MKVRAMLCAALLTSSPAFGDALERPEVDEAALEQHISMLRREASEELRARQARVLEVSFRLKTAAATLCREEVAPVLGAAISRRRDHLRGHEKEAEEAFGVVDEVKVLAVADSSPGEEAGLEVGDLIVAVNGSSTPKTIDVFAALRQLDGPPTIRARRGDEELDISLPRVEGCDHGVMVFVSGSPDTRSHRNKDEIFVPTGLLDIVRDDDELAIAIAHQMAHQVLGSTTPIDAKDEEPPADRLGLQMAARAGYDVSKAPEFWDRLAAEEPWKIAFDVGNKGSGRNYHVGMPARAPVIRSIVVEIQEGDAADVSLEP